MKCIHCGTDNNYRDRLAAGGCKGCRHPFAFDPRKDATLGMLTDTLFERAVKDVSGEGQVSYTPRQLYYEVSRRMLKKQTLALTGRGCGVGCGALAIGAALSVPMANPVPLIGFGIVGIVAAVLISRHQRRHELPRPPFEFDRWEAAGLRRWSDVHGRLERLALPPNPLQALPPPAGEPDLTSYSFDRVLVTDNAEIAAMLVANRFHFENNCAILSRDGYPFGRSQTILEMLRRNPQLKVLALHDASAAGCELPAELREGRWFPEPTVEIIDLGLRPSHAERLKLVTLKKSPPVIAERLKNMLTPEEIAWLEAGNVAEVASIRPARLMKAMHGGIARANRVPGDAVGDDWGPGFIWIDTGPHYGPSYHAADSFG